MRLINADTAITIWRENGCFGDESQEKIAEKLLEMLPTVERDKPVKAVKSKEARWGMGWDYYDFECPTCRRFLAFEPSPQHIPHRCPSCGQLIEGYEEDEK